MDNQRPPEQKGMTVGLRTRRTTGAMVDDCGRVVLLRGVNVEGSSRGEEQARDHLPTSGLDGQTALQSWGWNTVRFLVFWEAMEPEEGQYSEEYLDGVEKWLDWYAEHDIHVVLDVHQDLYSWGIGFNGAPEWAVDTRGIEPRPKDDSGPWYLRGTDPAVQAAYQSFWNPTEDQPDLQSLINAFPYPGDLSFDELSDPRGGASHLVYAGHLYEPDVHDGLGYVDGEAVAEPVRDQTTSVLLIEPDRALEEHQVCLAPAGSDACSA